MIYKQFDAEILLPQKEEKPKQLKRRSGLTDEEVDFIRFATNSFNNHEGLNLAFFVYEIKDNLISVGALFANKEDNKKFYEFMEALNIESKNVVSKEITFASFTDMLRGSYYRNFITDDDLFLERFSLKELKDIFHFFGENLIEGKGKKEILAEEETVLFSETLKEELTRIFDNKKATIKGHPCQYVLNSGNREWRKAAWKNLIEALYLQKRVAQKRYAYMDLNDEMRFSMHDYETLYRACKGGTVIIRFDDGGDEETDFARPIVGQLESLAKVIGKYHHDVLSIFVFPLDVDKEKSEILDMFEQLRFVEIYESSLKGESAKRFLTHKADEANLKVDIELLSKVDPLLEYSKDELQRLFGVWQDHKMCDDYYPNYKSIKVRHTDITALEENNRAYDELMELIGLDSAKKVINQAIDYFKVQKMYKDAGLEDDRPAMNMVFLGNPGSAKTTVARLFAKILKEKGILSSGHMVEVGRADLVGKYVGWTAPAVKKKYKEARGGVLFIDEAYSLVNEHSGSFGQEAVDAIVAECENHRDEVITIFAGYPKEMDKFLKSNPGLTSRIAFKVQFEDYDDEELTQIAKLIAKKKGLVLSDAAIEALNKHFKKGPVNGNGRYVRNVIEHARMAQASRIVKMDEADVTKDVLMTIMPEDLELDGADKHGVGEDREIGFC